MNASSKINSQACVINAKANKVQALQFIILPLLNVYIYTALTLTAYTRTGNGEVKVASTHPILKTRVHADVINHVQSSKLWCVGCTWNPAWGTPCRCCSGPGAGRFRQTPPGEEPAATPWPEVPTASNPQTVPGQFPHHCPPARHNINTLTGLVWQGRGGCVFIEQKLSNCSPYKLLTKLAVEDWLQSQAGKYGLSLFNL